MNTDKIYQFLCEIEEEEDIKLSEKAFIADFLTPKLIEYIMEGKE